MATDSPERVPEPARDVLLVGGPAPEGQGLHVLRAREGRTEVGLLRPLEHGKQLTGELVSLKQRPELPGLFDVEVQVPSPIPRDPELRAHHGPAQVASEQFRSGWDAIWGSRPSTDKRLLN